MANRMELVISFPLVLKSSKIIVNAKFSDYSRCGRFLPIRDLFSHPEASSGLNDFENLPQPNLPMTTATASAPPDTSQTFVSRVISFLKISPITTLIIYCVLSVVIRENFPFSNFPMYSNPSPERYYYTISEADGKGLPIATLTGITSPKIGKIYRKKADELSKEIGVSPSKFSQEQVQALGLEILTFLRQQAANKQQPLPAKLQINKIVISYQDGKIVETPSIFAKE